MKTFIAVCGVACILVATIIETNGEGCNLECSPTNSWDYITSFQTLDNGCQQCWDSTGKFEQLCPHDESCSAHCSGNPVTTVVKQGETDCYKCGCPGEWS